MPLVSIIIPVYNRAGMIAHTLRSVLDQSFSDFEIIVVDDGSTDATPQVVDAFPVRYLRQSNQGASVARNTGIEAARGRYISLLDSDDCLIDGSLESRVAVLEKYPDVGLAYGQILTIDDQGRDLGPYPGQSPHSVIRTGIEELHEILYQNHIPTSAVMVRKSCLDKVGLFNTALRSAEDLELWVRVCTEFRTAYIARPMVKWRVHDNRMTNRLSLAEYESSHRLILDSVFSTPDLASIFQSEHKHLYASHFYFMAEVAYMRREACQIVRYGLRAIRKEPGSILKKSFLKWILMIAATLIIRRNKCQK
jgi:glycosyltransferase involved in cell wall biosynthesis